MYTSSFLEPLTIYSRDDLRRLFAVTDATLNTGIFQPHGHDSIWLFVTEKKTADRTQYRDYLDGPNLIWQGQTEGRKDRLIIDHAANGLELLVFYRKHKYEFPRAAFRYMGRFEYQEHTVGRPSTFVLRRED